MVDARAVDEEVNVRKSFDILKRCGVLSPASCI